MKYVTIGGKRYRLVFARMRNDDGQCEHPQARGKRITIDPRVKPNSRKYLEILLHETLHAAFWCLDEEVVAQYARDAARILHNLGFRHMEEESRCPSPKTKHSCKSSPKSK